MTWQEVLDELEFTQNWVAPDSAYAKAQEMGDWFEERCNRKGELKMKSMGDEIARHKEIIEWKTQQKDNGYVNEGDVIIDSCGIKYSIDKRELPPWWHDTPEKREWWVQEYFAEHLQFTAKAIKILNDHRL